LGLQRGASRQMDASGSLPCNAPSDARSPKQAGRRAVKAMRRAETQGGTWPESTRHFISAFRSTRPLTDTNGFSSPPWPHVPLLRCFSQRRDATLTQALPDPSRVLSSRTSHTHGGSGSCIDRTLINAGTTGTSEASHVRSNAMRSTPYGLTAVEAIHCLCRRYIADGKAGKKKQTAPTPAVHHSASRHVPS
jgi:hypothetical protein